MRPPRICATRAGLVVHYARPQVSGARRHTLCGRKIHALLRRRRGEDMFLCRTCERIAR